MKLKLLVTLGVMSVASAVYAGDTSNAEIFKMLDKNNDGFITQNEVSSVKNLIQDWDSIDTDGSGSIAMTEFSTVESAGAYTPVETDEEPIGAAPTK